MSPIRIVDVAELSPVGAPFVPLHALDGRPVEWLGYSGLPRNSVERLVRRPRLSRYRAAWHAVQEGRRADVVISHLPRMSAAVERFAGARRPPHLAFSFNFTNLPVGADRVRLARALAPIEQFCVYSSFEVELYADALALDPLRIRPTLWTQSPPPVSVPRDVPDQPFVIAVGGEGRDFQTLLAAARLTPTISYLVIARPTAELAEAPANVTVRTNVPLAETWGYASRAAAVLVPLVGPETCCGHITIVSTRLLGLPLITTRSRATTDYVDGPGVMLLSHGDVAALGAAVRQAVEDADRLRAEAEAIRPILLRRHDRQNWTDYVADFVRGNISASPTR